MPVCKLKINAVHIVKMIRQNVANLVWKPIIIASPENNLTVNAIQTNKAGTPFLRPFQWGQQVR